MLGPGNGKPGNFPGGTSGEEQSDGDVCTHVLTASEVPGMGLAHNTLSSNTWFVEDEKFWSHHLIQRNLSLDPSEDPRVLGRNFEAMNDAHLTPRVPAVHQAGVLVQCVVTHTLAPQHLDSASNGAERCWSCGSMRCL